MFQESKGRPRRSTETQERFEGDILVGSSDLSDPTKMNAAIANPDRLWPSGVVEYKFWRTFPRSS